MLRLGFRGHGWVRVKVFEVTVVLGLEFRGYGCVRFRV